jgi:hypothetical protein
MHVTAKLTFIWDCLSKRKNVLPLPVFLLRVVLEKQGGTDRRQDEYYTILYVDF